MNLFVYITTLPVGSLHAGTLLQAEKRFPFGELKSRTAGPWRTPSPPLVVVCPMEWILDERILQWHGCSGRLLMPRFFP
jgi:hypothetical protein